MSTIRWNKFIEEYHRYLIQTEDEYKQLTESLPWRLPYHMLLKFIFKFMIKKNNVPTQKKIQAQNNVENPELKEEPLKEKVNQENNLHTSKKIEFKNNSDDILNIETEESKEFRVVKNKNHADSIFEKENESPEEYYECKIKTVRQLRDFYEMKIQKSKESKRL